MTEEEMMRQMAAQMRAAEYKGLSEAEIQEKERAKEMRKKKNIEILSDTLKLLEKEQKREEFKAIKVFLPRDIEKLRERSGERESNSLCTLGCENEDALALAERKYIETGDNILVLNLASATEPGGRSREGASAQEEDLCRRTSLLLSLESEEAKKYYEYNNSFKTRMGSDAITLSPCVKVIKNSAANLLKEPFEISVMSAAAPMIRLGLEGKTEDEFEAMFYKRIQGILLVAAREGYRRLILGAFGCGVYGNDAALVSSLFYRAISTLSYEGKDSKELFDSIDFAVLCPKEKDYNYREFAKYFAS